MFTHSVTLFRLFGFKVKADATWLLLAVLVTWSLAQGLFPHLYPDLSPGIHWAMGVLGALGLFLSIVLHELGHSLVARWAGLPISEITLFIFGGVANMEEEPKKPSTELVMALAGPATSILLGIIAWGVYWGGDSYIGNRPLFGVAWYLAIINWLLAGFNLIPAFPLDGGRVLRSVLWGLRGDLPWATRIASAIGSGFGLLLIVLGVLSFLGGDVIGGIWWVLIGLFVRGASSMSYKHVLIRRALQGESLRRFMKTDPVTVPPNIPLTDLLEHYVYKFHYKMYPVVDGDKLVGCVTTSDLKHVDRDEWASTPVRALAERCTDEKAVSPDEDPMKVLSVMSRTGNTRLLVVENGKLAGIVTLKDMLGFLSLKIDLEEGHKTG